MAFNFKAVWHKGITNQAPDALSHNPVNTPVSPQSCWLKMMRITTRNLQLLRLEQSTGTDWKVYEHKNFESTQKWMISIKN